jgi:DNA repair protein RecO (recombination protein O)
MRHKYLARALVLSRLPLGEASVSVSLLTEEFGLIRARAPGARKPGSKTAAALQTFALSDVGLVRGKDGWRTASAVLDTNWANELPAAARTRAARVTQLAERLVRGEATDPSLFSLLTAYVEALEQTPGELQDAAETLAALRLLHILGFDAGDTFGEADDFSAKALEEAEALRSELVTRVNRGITAFGL